MRRRNKPPALMSGLPAAYTYELRYPRMDIFSLADHVCEIENQALNDADYACREAAESLGAEPRGDFLYFDGIPYRILIDFQQTDRVLSVVIHPYIPPASAEVRHKTVELNDFGLVRTLCIRYPDPLERLADVLEHRLTEHFKIVYHWLELKVLTGFTSVGEDLIDGLFILLNLELERENKPALRGRIWFDITARRGYLFRYMFDRNRLESVIKHFKTHQVPEWSPLELVLALIADQARHTMNMRFNAPEAEFMSLPAGDFVSLDENLRFWQAEALMIDYKSISAFTIWKDNGFILQFSCDKAIEGDCLPIFRALRVILAERFQANIHRYEKYAKRLASIRIRDHAGADPYELAAAIGTGVGAALSEFLKGLNT